MTTETEQFHVSVAFADTASGQIRKLRGEMENLAGGAVSISMERTRRQAEDLQRQLIPLHGSFTNASGMVNTLISGLTPLRLGLFGIGAAAVGALANVERYRNALGDLKQQERELGLAAARLKKVDDEWKRAGMPDPQRETNRSAIARAIADVKRSAGSETARELQSLLQFGTQAERENIEKLMMLMQKGTYEEVANQIKESGDRIFEEQLRVTNSTVLAAQARNRLFSMLGVQGFELPIKAIASATKNEIEEMEQAIQQFGKLGTEIRRTKVAFGQLQTKVGELIGDYVPWQKYAENLAVFFKKRTADLKRMREEGILPKLDLTYPDFLKAFKNMPVQEPSRWDLLPDILRKRLRPQEGQPRVQQQSYNGGGGGAPIILASYQRSTDTLRDDVRETVILTEQFRMLNNLLRGAGGGGANAIRASLGGPSGGYGGGGGYGPSGTGTRGSGSGRTGPSTIPPSAPPSVSGMPGVRPGDVGIAAMARAGKPRQNLLASLQPTALGGARPIGLPLGGGGVAEMVQAGAAGGTAGGVPAEAGPRTGIPSLKMPELPYGVPYGGGAPPGPGLGQFEHPMSSPSVTEGAKQYLKEHPTRAPEGIPAAIRLNNPGGISITGGNVSNPDFWVKRLPGYAGMVPRPKDEGGYYAKFATPEHGIHAQDQLLQKYGQQGRGTVTSIINKWAAKGQTEYASYMRDWMGGEDVDLSDPKVRARFLEGAGRHEAGLHMRSPYTKEAYERGTSGRFRGDAGQQTPTGLQANLEKAYGSTAAAVDDMMAMLGKEEGKAADREMLIAYINSGGKQTSEIRGRSNAWCAWMVNAALTRQGIENPRSGAAGSYARRGVGVTVSPQDARKGDIFLVPGSGGAEGGIAHVGLVTGPMNRDGTIPTISGNTGQNISDGGMVGTRDYRAGAIHIKRLPEPVRDNKTATQSGSGVKSFAAMARRPGRPFIDTGKMDRALGGEVRPEVKGDGEIEVDVKGPRGTKVTANVSDRKPNIFKRASVNRVKEKPADEEKPAPKAERVASRTDEE